MRAKDRVGRVGQIGLGLIGGRLDYALGIMTGRVTGELQIQMPATARVGSHLQRVILHLGCRYATHKLRTVARHRRRLVLGTHARGIRERPAHALPRHLELKAIPRLQQHRRAGLTHLHQTLANRAVRGLAKIATLGVLGMSAATRERNANIGDGRAGQHAQVIALHGVGECQTLPVKIELVGRGHGTKLHARTRWQRLQTQMHLGIVAQRLKVAHALDRLRNSLLIENAAGLKRNRKAKAIGQYPLHDLELHGAHQLQMNLFKMRIPAYAEHGILVGKLGQRLEHRTDIVFARKHRIGEDRRNDGRIARGLRAQGVPRANVRKARHGANTASSNFLGKLILLAVIDAHLISFLLPSGGARASLDNLLCTQYTARHLDPGKTLATVSTTHAVDTRGELLGPCSLTHQRAYTIQQLVHAPVLERRPGKAGKELALGNHARQRCDGKLTRFKKLLERRLVQRSSVLLNGAARQQFAGIQAAFGKTLPKLCQQNIAAGILQIDFVDIDECRNVIARKQAPQGFGVPLHAIVGTHNQNRIVECAQRALCLSRKIDMPRRIHEHDVGIAMVEHGLRRENRDATFALDLVRIQMRIAIVHAAALANATRVEQHGLGQRGLAGIDMRQDSNDRLLRHGSPLITSPSHAATGILVPHWMIQFTGRRAKRALSPDRAHRPALPRGDFRRFAPCESRHLPFLSARAHLGR